MLSATNLCRNGGWAYFRGTTVTAFTKSHLQFEYYSSLNQFVSTQHALLLGADLHVIRGR